MTKEQALILVEQFSLDWTDVHDAREHAWEVADAYAALLRLAEVPFSDRDPLEEDNG